MTNDELYGKLPRVTAKIAKRRFQLAGHCLRHRDDLASKLLLWEPMHGYVNRRRKLGSYAQSCVTETSGRVTSNYPFFQGVVLSLPCFILPQKVFLQISFKMMKEGYFS